MKTRYVSILTSSLFFMAVQLSSAQSLNQLLIRENGQKDLLGLCDRESLQMSPFQEWFTANYDSYPLDKELLNKIADQLPGVTIDIFMGTWCGDSRREVPRFYKILDQLNFSEDNIRLINVDKTPEAYKKSPTHEEHGKLIHRVPTFIFYKEGKEIGRVVESPVTSLEMDLAQILSGFPSSPTYQVVNRMDDYFKEYGLPKDDEEILKIARAIYRETCSDRALNTYGYYLIYNGDLDKAIVVFRINALLYKTLPNVYDSLGEAYLLNDEPEKALEMYKKVFSMDDSNEHAQKQIEMLESVINEKSKGKSGQ